ncbi:hypothetical protein JI750_15940 [Flavobacterium sp. GN10]|uniref:Phosphoribosylpyrophosphate synthetase n=1 Tax=Flavobacterium tagetis TaxID=2801336 RepID=A0ABS1KGK0_9FLAO|nr:MULTISPECIES: hypothetical protein [Flavobacterium]KAF2079763.1 hypothetical protein DMA14_15120 [Flavobacterium sharifuzzamanii]MBL0738388.1 hypothetical protein [Flavobacterium tagetis]WDF66546.1 hypothetical protein PQ463_10335 [Flavobacterium sp. KACC 22763]
MKRMYHYATVSKALDQLNEKGFTCDFNRNADAIKKNPEKFEIVHVYRYEGESDPADEAVVYGIKSTTGKKGVYVAGFSADSDQETAQFLLDLSIKRR